MTIQCSPAALSLLRRRLAWRSTVVEIHDHDILDAGEYRGHSGFTRWVEDWGTGLPIVSLELQEFIDAGAVGAAGLAE